MTAESVNTDRTFVKDAHIIPFEARPSWRRSLSNAVTGLTELLDLLEIPLSDRGDIPKNNFGFPLFVTREYLSRIQPGNIRDPLLLQVIPDRHEGHSVSGFIDDAVGDLNKLGPGAVIRKYDGRALVIATGACAIHCRYCFRRQFPYSQARPGTAAWHDTLEQIRKSPDIREVILSGGDPFMLSDEKLSALTKGLETIPHVKRLRIHTRMPVVLPGRINDELLSWLDSCNLQTVIVIHANHPGELDEEVATALEKLSESKIPLLNQSVLLRHVNDNARTLNDLSERLFELRVLPYYLHLLDRVSGTAHFEVGEHRARRLHRHMQDSLPGYLVPRLVREVPDAAAKQLIR